VLGAALALTGCGGASGSEASGRACRIGERMVAAFDAGDFRAAEDEVGRLADLDDADVPFDVDEIADIVDDARSAESDDLVDLLVDGGCAIDAPDVTEVPTTSNPTITEIPPFTLPIPTTTNVPPSTTAAGPATTAADTTPTTGADTTVPPPPRRPARTVEVDVGGIGSDQLPAGSGETPAGVADRYEIAGMIVPGDPASVVSTYVSRGLNYGSTADSITSIVDSELPLTTIVERFRQAITGTGRYEFGESVTAADDSEGISAQPVGDGPSWEVEVSRSPDNDQLVEIRVARYEFGDSAERTVPTDLGRLLAPQLAVIDELGWQPENVGELRSYRGGPSALDNASVSATVESSTPEAAADTLAARTEDTTIETGEDEITLTTPDGRWQFSDFGGGDVFVYFSTST
jgi:hypothetical protein